MALKSMANSNNYKMQNNVVSAFGQVKIGYNPNHLNALIFQMN